MHYGRDGDAKMAERTNVYGQKCSTALEMHSAQCCIFLILFSIYIIHVTLHRMYILYRNMHLDR